MKKGGNKFCKFFSFVIIVIILNLALVRQVFCYDTNIAHPGIAELAVKQYNKNSSQKISLEQLGWIKYGAVNEDEPTRWLNHFYDPIYNRGLYFGKQHDSAKVWAKNPSGQTKFSQGDNSWQRAINDFRKGNEELAFKGLGHNIHLVSDMLVPAHTRDSIHAVPPDSYEQYVKNNWDTVIDGLKVEIVNKNSLEEIFDEAAKYSNGNFYSDKTIEISRYKINNVDKFLKVDAKDHKIQLAQINSKDGIINLYAMDGADWKKDKQKIINNNLVLSNISSHLLPKAVGYSANTIKLFLAETQKIEKEKIPFFRVGLGGLVNNGVGKIISAAENIYDYARSQTPNDQIASGQNTDNSAANNNLNNNTILVSKEIVPVVKPIVVLKKPVVQSQNPIIVLLAPNQSSNLTTPNVVTNNPNKNNSVTAPKYYSGGSGGGGGSSAPIIPVVKPLFNNIIFSTTSSTETNYINNSTSTLISTTTISQTTSTTDLTSSTSGIIISTTTFTSNTTSTPTTTSNTTSSASTNFPTSTVNITSSTPDITTSTAITSTTVNISTTTISNTSTISITSTTSTVVSSTVVTSTIVTSTPAPVPPVPDVVINEIAWAGTSAATDQDEYIELFNNTNQDISLFSATNTAKWWKLMIGDKEISISKIINGIIPKNGYYLFERTDDRTVNEIPADIIYSGVMKNSGERLRLLDGNSQLVDEVNCSSTSWFAGSSTTYASMEKINSQFSGNTSTNWQTNKGPRFEGKVDGGGDVIPLNGSPKQSNFGSIVLKSTQTENNRTLSKSDYPYILTYYEIPIGKTFNIDPGVVIKTYYPDSKIDVKGKLNINGASNSKVIMTSGRDANFEDEKNKVIIGTLTGNPQAKDWQGFQMYTSSTANLFGLDLRYAGKTFRAPNANMWDLKVSQAIRSDSATININNSIFSDDGDSNIYLSKSTSTIKNSDFKNGLLAIENFDGSLELENINLNNFTNSNGSIYIKNIWPKMSQINFVSNTANNIVIDQTVISSNLIVNKDVPIAWQNITIAPNVVVDVSAGTNIKMPEYSYLFVKGILNLNGTESESVTITPLQQLTNYYWSRIIFDGGKGNWQNADISGGRGSNFNDGYQGMVTVKNGELNMQNCQLLGSRAPGNTLEINSSTVAINNSAIGYIGSKPNFTNTNGIKINSGELMLNNTNLMNLDIGILSESPAPYPKLILNNMDSRNFMNVGIYWNPILWIPKF